MKEVKVRIVGDLLIVDYCSKKVMDEAEDDGFDKFCSNYYVTGAWDKVEALYVDDNEEENSMLLKTNIYSELNLLLALIQNISFSDNNNNFDDVHYDWCEVIPHCRLDLHFANNYWC